MAEQGLATFPGIKDIVSCSYTLGHGITPGVATMVIVPQKLTEGEGTLTFSFGGTQVKLPDCLVDEFSFDMNPDTGEIWRLSIYDRRWKWAYGKISGMYNVRTQDGKIINGSNGRGATLASKTEKKPSELCKLCLDEMGEKNADVSQVPDDTRPFIEWDVTNPAQALAELCDVIGCRVVLGLDNRVKICPKGQGSQLPKDETYTAYSGSINPPNGWASVTVTTGKTLYQDDFELEAVGFEPDGSIRPIDELSYIPEGDDGWDDIDIVSFNAVKEKKNRELAQECVFKVYRVKLPHDLKDWKMIDDITLLGLTNEQVVTTADYDSKGNLLPNRQTKALVYGDYYQQNGNYENTGTTKLPQTPTKDEMKTVVTSFDLEPDRGLITFSDYMFKLEGTENKVLKPAVLKLRTAANVRDEKTRGWIRWGDTQGKGKPEKIIEHDEIVLAYKDGKSNRKEVDAQTKYYLTQAFEQIQAPQTARYAGLKWIDLDGAIQQVSFEVGTSGCFTSASRSNDHDKQTPSFEERRFYEQLRAQRTSKKLATESKIKKAAK